MFSQSQQMLAPGAYLQSFDTGTLTGTLASGYTVLTTPANIGGMIIDLPASQKYTVQTTTGNGTAVVTAGPRPCELAICCGLTRSCSEQQLISVDGYTFPQTITVADAALSATRYLRM